MLFRSSPFANMLNTTSAKLVVLILRSLCVKAQTAHVGFPSLFVIEYPTFFDVSSRMNLQAMNIVTMIKSGNLVLPRSCPLMYFSLRESMFIPTNRVSSGIINDVVNPLIASMPMLLLL